jgi:hypothetical protein
MSRAIFCLLAIAALLLVSPAPIQAWGLIDSTLAPVPLTGAIRPMPSQLQADFDGDSQPETLTLENDRAALRSGAQLRWQSPPTWQVRQALIADLNHDGLPEAVLLVWRPFRPWPVDAWLPNGGRIKDFHDSAGMSCQIILIGWYENEFRERWAGSALAEPVKSLVAADLPVNGRQLLVTLESRYDDPPSAPARRLKIWEWNGFGFTIVSTLEGPFSQMAVASMENGRLVILTP